jgi:hypothetical protein
MSPPFGGSVLVMAVIKIEELTKPLFAISDDLERAEKELITNADSSARRNYIRALFAAIELTIYILKQTILIAASSETGKLSAAELALLREETFDLKSNGEAHTRKKVLRVADNLLFTTRQVEKWFALSLNLDPKSSSWIDFTNAIEIRNRLACHFDSI